VIGVVVAEDHPLYREAVAALIRRAPGLELLGEAGDGRTALERVRELRPDVAVLDMRMPELDGLRVLNAIVRDGLPTRVICLSAHADGGSVYAALGAGAAGFLSKDASAEALVDAVTTVARGGTALPPDAQGEVASAIRMRSSRERPVLTEREHEVLALAAAGQSSLEIARRLQLGQTTVKTHLRNLYQKLSVSDRAAAVAEAMRHGLLE
jgi:two-component system, NarL family, nitrate/nitrite response regulator NarL